MQWLIALFMGVQPMTGLVVETFDGEVYVIGSGDTCRDAWVNHAPFPEDWRELRCEVIWVAE
jgi:hypothetical protein